MLFWNHLQKSLGMNANSQVRLNTPSEMLKRKLRFSQLKRCKLLLVAAFTLLTVSVVKIHQRTAYENTRHLELREDSSDSQVKCAAIFRGDQEAIEEAKLETIKVSFKNRPRLTANDYINMTRDCGSFVKARKYILQPLSKEEAAFPIAYSIVVHHKIDMFEKLLRTIYTPQNYYCIHVDKKSPETFLAAAKGIASCFENVFIASQMESVVYASWSRVQADINCMKDLHRVSDKWKYLINLCGMDFPIKTNLETVEKLKVLNGQNSLESERMPANKEWRWRKHHEIIDGSVKSTAVDKEPPPFGMPVLSGSAYFVISRQFVEYVLDNEKVLKFIEWAKDTYSPDEFLWASIQRFPEAPGFVPNNEKHDVSDMNSIARFVKWHYYEGDISKGAPYSECRGVHVRAVCVFGAGDLSWMLRIHHLFANKFDIDTDPFAVQCLEEHLREKALYHET